MSKKTVRKTSGRVKDALIKAGPEKSEIQAELNQDFPGRYKLITAVVLGTMAASAGAVTSATINVASPGSGTVAVTTTDDNIVVSGTDTLSIGLASNVTGLTSIAATTVTGTTVNVGGVALTADGNGGISVAGITSSETISGGTLKVGESDTWSSAGGLAVSGNITTSTGTVKGATVQAGDNITLSGSTGGISGTTLTTTGNITTSTGDISAYGDVKGATVHVGNIALSTGDSSELSVSTGITAGGDISAGTNTVTGGTFQISGQGTANQWTSSLLTAAAVTSTGNLTVGDNKLTVTAASGDVASAGKVEAAGNVVAGNGGSYTVTLSAEDGSVTASGNITAGANGTIGFTNSNTNKWTNADGLTASKVTVGASGAELTFTDSTLNVSTAIKSSGAITGTTVEGSKFQLTDHTATDYWDYSNGLNATKITSSGKITAAEGADYGFAIGSRSSDTWTSAGGLAVSNGVNVNSGKVVLDATNGDVTAARNITAGSGGSYTVVLNGTDGSVTAAGKITAASGGTGGFAIGTDDTWTSTGGLKSSNGFKTGSDTTAIDIGTTAGEISLGSAGKIAIDTVELTKNSNGALAVNSNILADGDNYDITLDTTNGKVDISNISTSANNISLDAGTGTSTFGSGNNVVKITSTSSAGSVQVGTDTSGVKLSQDGNITATGTISGSGFSGKTLEAYDSTQANQANKITLNGSTGTSTFGTTQNKNVVINSTSSGSTVELGTVPESGTGTTGVKLSSEGTVTATGNIRTTSGQFIAGTVGESSASSVLDSTGLTVSSSDSTAKTVKITGASATIEATDGTDTNKVTVSGSNGSVTATGTIISGSSAVSLDSTNAGVKLSNDGTLLATGTTADTGVTITGSTGKIEAKNATKGYTITTDADSGTVNLANTTTTGNSIKLDASDGSIAVGTKVTDISGATAGVTIQNEGDIIASGSASGTGVKILGSTGDIEASGDVKGKTLTAYDSTKTDNQITLSGTDGTITAGTQDAKKVVIDGTKATITAGTGTNVVSIASGDTGGTVTLGAPEKTTTGAGVQLTSAGSIVATGSTADKYVEVSGTNGTVTATDGFISGTVGQGSTGSQLTSTGLKVTGVDGSSKNTSVEISGTTGGITASGTIQGNVVQADTDNKLTTDGLTTEKVTSSGNITAGALPAAGSTSNKGVELNATTGTVTATGDVLVGYSNDGATASQTIKLGSNGNIDANGNIVAGAANTASGYKVTLDSTNGAVNVTNVNTDNSGNDIKLDAAAGEVTVGSPTLGSDNAAGVKLTSSGTIVATGATKDKGVTIDGANGDVTATGTVTANAFSGKVLSAYDSTEGKTTNKITLDGTNGTATFGTTDGKNVVITSTSSGSTVAVGNNVTDISAATAGVTLSDTGDIIASGANTSTGVKVLGSAGTVTASGDITTTGGSFVAGTGVANTANSVLGSAGLTVTGAGTTPESVKIAGEGTVKATSNIVAGSDNTETGFTVTLDAESGAVNVANNATTANSIKLDAANGEVTVGSPDLDSASAAGVQLTSKGTIVATGTDADVGVTIEGQTGNVTATGTVQGNILTAYDGDNQANKITLNGTAGTITAGTNAATQALINGASGVSQFGTADDGITLSVGQGTGGTTSTLEVGTYGNEQSANGILLQHNVVNGTSALKVGSAVKNVVLNSDGTISSTGDITSTGGNITANGTVQGSVVKGTTSVQSGGSITAVSTITAGSDANQVVMNGSNGTFHAGTGDKQVSINAADATLVAGSADSVNAVKLDGLTGSVLAGVSPTSAKGSYANLNSDGTIVAYGADHDNNVQIAGSDGSVTATGDITAGALPTGTEDSTNTGVQVSSDGNVTATGDVNVGAHWDDTTSSLVSNITLDGNTGNVTTAEGKFIAGTVASESASSVLDASGLTVTSDDETAKTVKVTGSDATITAQNGTNKVTVSGDDGTITSTGNITAGALPTADAQTATGVELASATGDVTATGDVKVGAHWDTKTNSLVSNITLDGATGDIKTTGAISGEGFSGKILTAYDDSTDTKANKIELNGTTGVSTFGTTEGQNVIITSTSDGSSIAVGNNVADIDDETAGVTITADGNIIASGEDADKGVKILGSRGEITASGTITADGDNPVVLNGSDGTLTTGKTVVSTTGLLVTDGLQTPALTTAVTNDGIVIKNTVGNVTTTNSLTSSGLVATSGAFSDNVTVGTGNKKITLDATTGGVTAPLATINGIVIGKDGKISNLTSGLVADNSKEAVTGDAVFDAIAAAKWSAVVQTTGAQSATTVDVSTSGNLGFAAGKNMSVSVNEGVITYATSATPTFDSVTVGTATGQQTKIEGGAVTANTVTTGKTSMSTDGVTVTDATNAKVTTTVAASGVTAADGTNTTTLSSTGVVIGTGANKLTTEGLTATTGSFTGDVTVGKKITLDADTGNVKADTATIGGISIGTDGKISNLTSGTIEANNKEAVTGGAVYSYVSGSYVSKADAGWNIKVGNAEADKIGTDATVSFNAGSTNVSLSYNADTNAVTVDTAKDVTFDTVTANTSFQVGTGENATKITGNSVSAQTLKAGNSTVTTDGLSVKTADGTKTSTVTTDGLSVTDGTNTASYQANGVTVGKDGANALTTDGLTASAAKIKGDVSVGDQITMAADTGTIIATNAKFGNLTFNTTGVEIAGGPSLTSNGIDAANLTIRNVKAGELSATSTEAVNGSQLYATNQAVEANTNSITALRGDTTRLKNRINRVGAQSAALAALQPLPFAEGQNVSVSIGAGAYRGAAAGALGIYYRPTENMMLSLGGSVTAGDVMGNVGFSYRFGTSGLTTEKPQTMAAKISSLSKENADLTAQLTAARTRLESQETRLLKLEALVEKLSAGK